MKSIHSIAHRLEINFSIANINEVLTKHEHAQWMKPVVYQYGKSRYYLKLIFNRVETTTAQIKCKYPW